MVHSTAAATTTDHGVPQLNHLSHKSLVPNVISNLSIIILRFILISFIGITAIWANHEASKGFSITVVNDAGKYSLPGKRFSLVYKSSDKAVRIVLNTSRFVENLLYPNEHFLPTKKQINGVTLRLAPTDLPAMVTVSLQKPHQYLISLSPSVIENPDNNEAVVVAVLQGMARVWLWDGRGTTPPELLNGMVEYISSLAGLRLAQVWKSGGGANIWPESNEFCWKDEDPKRVAGFLRYLEQTRQAVGGGEVIRRLNEAMRDGWHDRMVDDALGMAGHNACEAYDKVIRQHYRSSSM